jgi:hypothetical protein
LGTPPLSAAVTTFGILTFFFLLLGHKDPVAAFGTLIPFAVPSIGFIAYLMLTEQNRRKSEFIETTVRGNEMKICIKPAFMTVLFFMFVLGNIFAQEVKEKEFNEWEKIDPPPCHGMPPPPNDNYPDIRSRAAVPISVFRS